MTVMDILLSLLEFAASYNSPSNLRIRMHHTSAERYFLWELFSSSFHFVPSLRVTCRVSQRIYEMSLWHYQKFRSHGVIVFEDLFY